MRRAQATVDALPWKQREAIVQSVAEGKAVPDEALAEIAAEWASARRAAAVRASIVLLGVAVLAASVLVVASVVAEGDASAAFGGAGVAAMVAIVIGVGISWAVTIAPLRRAERCNLALLGRGHPPGRDASNWLFAVMIWWGILAFLGPLLLMAGIERVPGTYAWAGWVVAGLAIFGIKRALDSRDRD